MASTIKMTGWLIFQRLKPALLTGLVLFSACYAMDNYMARIGISSAKTIVNDLALGILGALAVLFYHSASYEKVKFQTAKEHLDLVRELNLCVRDALGTAAISAMSEDRFARLKGIDEATDRIDCLLSEFCSRLEAGDHPLLAWSRRGHSGKSPAESED